MNCPICKEELILENKTFRCRNNHSFDKARQGYVNLSLKQKPSGDNKQMVQARTAFLNHGYYDFLKGDVEKLVMDLNPEVLVDLGCGQGYYTKDLALHADTAYGIDLSKDAVSYAAAHDKKTQYIVGSIYDLPFEDESVDVITSIFTPIPQQEILRTLKPGGHFISVSPGINHHFQLKEVLYDHVLLNDEPSSIEGMDLAGRHEIKEKRHVEDVMSLLEMTPYQYKCSKEGMERLKKKEGLDVDFDFVIQVWRKP